jgi:hypothetical protein
MTKEIKESVIGFMFIAPFIFALLVTVITLIVACFTPPNMDLVCQIWLWDFFVWIGGCIVGFMLSLNWKLI